MRNVADGNSKRLTLEPGNLDTGLAGYLTFRDPPGSDPTADGAHGSAFDRVGAFQEGYDKGPERCKAFAGDPPQLVDIPFADAGDLDRGGDLPYREVIPQTAHDLDVYWSGLLTDYRSVQHITPYDPTKVRPACGGQKMTKAQAVDGIAYCPETRTIVYDRDLLPDVYHRSGDFGVAVVLASEWAVAMQTRPGRHRRPQGARAPAELLHRFLGR